MFNRKQSVLMSTMLLGSLVTIASPKLKANAVNPNHFTNNVIPVKTGHEYELDNGSPVPIVLRVSPRHRDYKFMAANGMQAQDGNIYMYLQSYKDQIYYYSPILREYTYGSPRKEDGINRDVMLKLRNTSMWPANSQGKGDDWLAGNSIKAHSRGQKDDKNFNPVTKALSGLHHYIPGTSSPDYNFRTKTTLPPSMRPWTTNNLRGPNNSHSDNYKKHGGSWKFGEYRQLGYHPTGVNFVNPYFPVDGMRAPGHRGFAEYPLLQYPWGRAYNRQRGILVSEIDEKVYQYAMHVGKININEQVNPLENRKHWQNIDKSIVWNQSTLNDYRRAYEEKKLSMRSAYERSPQIQQNSIIRSMSKNQAIEALTVKYGSLSTSAVGTDANLSIGFGREYEPYNDTWYSVDITIPGEIYTTKIQDLKIRNQKVYDGGLLQTFTRFEKGNGYDTRITNNAKVGMNFPEVEPGTEVRVDTFVDIEDSYQPYSNAVGILELSNSQSTKRTSQYLPNKGKIHRYGSTFSSRVRTPNNLAGDFVIFSELNKPYYNKAMDMREDNEENTAQNIIELARDKGEFVPTGMDLIDRNNQVVQNPIPGHEYKIRYRYRYDGVIASNVVRTGDVKLTYDIGREMRGPVISGYENSGKKTLYPINTSARSTLYNGKPFIFETPYHVYETGQLDSQNVLDADIEDEITIKYTVTSCSSYNGVTSCSSSTRTRIEYDYYSLDAKDGKDWKSDYDISVENVHVIPRDIENSHTQVSPTLVKFDINYKTPSFIKDLGHDVDVAVKVGDQIVETRQHIRSGLNRNISIPVDTVYIGNQDNLVNAEIFVNYNEDIYESDDGVKNITLRNNYATGQGEVKRPNIVPFRDSNNYANWNQYFSKNNWFGENINYKSFSGPNVQFNRFTTRDNQRSEYKNFYEEYKIDEVRFRSRLTRQEEMGKNKDGWINLLEEDGYIKAGYGYELEIDVSYKTNADTNNYDKTGLSGTWSRPQITEPLLQDNVYVQLPNDVIRSVQGDGGTLGKLRLKSTQGTKLDKKWTFEIDGGDTLGVETTGRFYFGEEVTDGRYAINVFTPKIRGVNGKMTSSHSILEHLLYDSKNDLGIHVIGADVDDITDHINR